MLSVILASPGAKDGGNLGIDGDREKRGQKKGTGPFFPQLVDRTKEKEVQLAHRLGYGCWAESVLSVMVKSFCFKTPREFGYLGKGCQLVTGHVQFER